MWKGAGRGLLRALATTIMLSPLTTAEDCLFLGAVNSLWLIYADAIFRTNKSWS
jgi:hypothetical protein